MDQEGYPEQSELDLIENWNIRDAFALIDFIKDRWTYDSAMICHWGKDEFKRTTLYLEMHTIGWSGNESLIEALLKNRMFCLLWYHKWERGGHYYFQIHPQAIGFKKVPDMAKDKGISRQRIHHNKEAYDWVTIGAKMKICREKNNSLKSTL